MDSLNNQHDGVLIEPDKSIEYTEPSFTKANLHSEATDTCDNFSNSEVTISKGLTYFKPNGNVNFHRKIISSGETLKNEVTLEAEEKQITCNSDGNDKVDGVAYDSERTMKNYQNSGIMCDNIDVLECSESCSSPSGAAEENENLIEQLPAITVTNNSDSKHSYSLSSENLDAQDISSTSNENLLDKELSEENLPTMMVSCEPDGDYSDSTSCREPAVENGNDEASSNYEEDSSNTIHQDVSDAVSEIKTSVTKLGSESIVHFADCTKVTFEAVCIDCPLTAALDEKQVEETNSDSESCYIQTLVEGSLQPLDVENISEKGNIFKDPVLFAAVSEDMTVASESDMAGGYVINSTDGVCNIDDEYNNGSIIVNLTEPPPVNLESEIMHTDLSVEEEKEEGEQMSFNNMKSDNENIFQNNFSMPEGKPLLLKVMPLKNGHDLWSISELHLALAEKGSVLLRLCAAPEAGDEDIIDGPLADFSALLLDDRVMSTDIDVNLDSNDMLGEAVSVFKTSAEDDEDEDRIYAPPVCFEMPKPLLPPSLISRQNFMERMQRPQSPQLFEEIPAHIRWKGRHSQASPKKRNCLPPPFTSAYRSKSHTIQLTPRGKRRGRPPLHNRAHIPPNPFIIQPKFLGGPIKFRPPTPPSVLFSEESKDSADVQATPKKSIPFDPRTICSSLVGLKKAAPGSILSRHLKAIKEVEKKVDLKEDSVSELSDEVNIVKERVSNSKLIRIPCEHCTAVFRKKSALTTHIKLRHRLLRKCPVCKESVRCKGKNAMKFHILLAHKDEKNFNCDLCNDSFNLLHHLQNHMKLVHDADVSCDENLVETSSETGLETNEKTVPKKKLNGSKSFKDRSDGEDQAECNMPKRKDSLKTKDERKKFSNFVVSNYDSDSKESLEIVSRGRTRLRSQVANTSSKTASENKESKPSKIDEQDSGSESGNESDDEEESLSGSSDSEVEEPKKYFCNKCEEGFSHLFKLKHHYKARHHMSKSKDVLEGVGSQSTQENFRCKICNKQCRSMTHLQLHQLQHKRMSTQRDLKISPSVRASELSEPVVLRNNKKLERDPVKTTTTASTRSSIRLQKTDDTDSPRIKETAKSAEAESDDSDTAGKIKSMRGSERPSYIIRKGRMLYCTKCNLAFKREKSMTYHLKKIHETLYPFRACPHCSRVFRSCGPYTRHLSQHSGKRCPVNGCKAKYKVLRLIKKHQRHAHPEKPYRCSRCVELYATQRDLQSHMKKDHAENKQGEQADEEEEEEEEDEEEDTDEIDEEKEKQETKNRSAAANAKSNRKAEKRKSVDTDEILPVRRTRSVPISYKEEDDEEEESRIESASKIYLQPPMKKPKLLPDVTSKVSNCHVASYSSYQSMWENAYNSGSIKSFDNRVVKNKISSEAPINFLSATPNAPVVRQKRPYNRKAPYTKRKPDTSWTAAFKAKHFGFSTQSSKRLKAQRITKMSHPSSSSYLSSSSTYSSTYTPVVTADVVRRVAESLMSRHQEQQQQKIQLKLQKKQQKRTKVSPIRYSSSSSRLPRIPYGSHFSSRDDSLSSFGDSSHTDQLSDYCARSTSAAAANKVPDDDDGGPAKILRFDSF